MVLYNLKPSVSPVWLQSQSSQEEIGGERSQLKWTITHVIGNKGGKVMCFVVLYGKALCLCAAHAVQSADCWKGSRLMALLAFLQMLDSNMAVGRRPKEGQRPQGSSREAIKILKRQKLQCVSHHTLCLQSIFMSVVFYYCVQDGKHCWSDEKQQEYTREAVKPALTIPTTVTTSLNEMKTH